MAAVEDVLATRLDLLGLGGYVGGFDQATAAVGLHESALTSAQGRALSFGVAAGAVGLGGLNFFRKAALAAGEDVATFGRASANLKGQLSPGELADFTGELERATGVADDSIAGFVGLLGTFQATGDQAKQLAEPILNAAEALKAQGVSTEQLAVQVGKALQTGDAGPLKRSGIIIEEAGFKAATAAERVNLLEAALNAQGGTTAARDALNTLPGAINAAATSFGSLQEALGAPLVGPLKTAADLARGAANAFTALPAPLQATVTLVGVGLSGALVVYSAQTVIAIAQTVRLARAQLEAAAAANTMAAANGRAGAAAVASAGGKGRFALSTGDKVLAAAAVADVGLNFLPDDFGFGAGGALKNIGNKALMGASIGRLFGVPGAAVGGALGAGFGAVENLVTGGGDSKAQTEAEKQTALLQQIAGNTGRTPLSANVIPEARQIGALSTLRQALT